MDLLQITNQWSQKLKQRIIDIAALVYARKRGVPVFVDEQMKSLVPLFDDLFASGRDVSVSQIKKDLIKYTDRYDYPLKYNKDVLDKINGPSVFTGYFDTEYKTSFTRKEILELKKTILSAKYSDLSEAELRDAILGKFNTTKRRAQLLARNEIQRLRSASLDVYWKNSGIRKKYKKVFVSQPDARPTHKSYDGQVADEDGYFYGDLGRVSRTPLSINCRCRIVLRKK
jgi:hypothetical protein